MEKEYVDFSNLDLNGIISKFKDMLESEDHKDLFANAEMAKSVFYKVLNVEKEKEGADVSLAEENFKELYGKYRQIRMAHVQDIEKEKEENYVKKLQIIEELRALLEKAEDVNHTFPEFRELQNRWRAIDMVPQAKAKDLWDTYQHYVEKFYDYIKINNEFRDMDFKKNLEAKTSLCERAEALVDEPNVVGAFKELQKLHDEWKEIGPVAKEFRESIWERFKGMTSVINKRHQAHFEQLKEEQKKNLDAKVQLCEKAEEIAAAVPQESGDWNALSKQMENLQAQWKNVGFAAKKENQKIYDRFREACDKFYNSKREYYANFKNVMQDNLKLKEQLCEKAEALMDSEDWKKATDQLIQLQKQWKEIGPVARKQSDAVWKRFRAACDHFFDNKAKHFDKVDEQYGGNLALKLALIEEVKAYKVGDTREDDINAMREFQNRWNAIGYVPFKEKEKVQKEFNTALDMHFADIRSLEGEKKLNKFRRMVAEVKNSGKGDRGLRFEREKLLLKYRKMEQDIATLENNMGFFARTKNADSMIADVKKKISIAKEELARIEEKIRIIDNQFE
ncbi:MAG: DUF349 domain-containing protein [Bacteroidales bacterium]|nr:DUF349 domain-containing protein [Bacteroidales bacterium]